MNDMALAKETSFALKADSFKLDPPHTNQGSMMPNECLNKLKYMKIQVLML